DPHELNGVDWPEVGCGPSHDTTWCPPEGEPGEKQFNRFGWDTAPPVAIYHGVECSTVGFSEADAEQAAREGLRLGEQRALEEWVQANVLATAATDVTPVGGPVNLSQSIALLEGELASVYGGVGVIHAPAGIAAMLGAT